MTKITTIPSTDENYPKEFLAIEDYPPIIYAMGDISLLKSPSKVAIIGAREADGGNFELLKKGVAKEI